jgi:hypothetical protein
MKSKSKMACMRTLATTALLCAVSLAGSAHASTIYMLNDQFDSNTSLTGTITTDGTIGVLAQSNITAFDLTVTAIGASGEITNLNNFISPFLGGSAVSATAAALSFDFSANGFFQIANASAAFSACGTGNLCSPNNEVALEALVAGSTSLETLVQQGQTVEFASATPLPGALPLFASGAGVVGFFGWRRKRKVASA